jgi:hypothetical protein
MRRERCATPRHSDTVSDEITGLAPVGAGLPVFLIEDLNPASDCLSNRFGSQLALDHPRSALFLERPYQRVFRAAARHLNERGNPRNREPSGQARAFSGVERHRSSVSELVSSVRVVWQILEPPTGALTMAPDHNTDYQANALVWLN